MKNEKEIFVLKSSLNLILREIEEIENGPIAKLKKKITPLRNEILLLEFEETFKRIKTGKNCGIKSHWCSPFYYFDVNNWEKLGWKSPEEYIFRCCSENLTWITFNENEIDYTME